MACHRKETRLGAAGGIGLVARFGQRALAFGTISDVAADALHFRRLSCIVSDQPLAPGDPSCTERACDPLVVDPRAVRFQRGVALFENGERGGAADQTSRGCCASSQ